jgi:two-component system, OmpR family, phosphate regulon sensor histidine kinase PhoR
MLRTIVSFKTAFAVLLVLAGAYIAGQLYGNFERMTVMMVTSLIALFVATENDDRAELALRSNNAPAPPIRLNEYTQFQDLLNGFFDPVILVENARVTNANQAALQLFGSDIINQNVKIAFRHAGAIERLSDPDINHDGRPIRLIGIGLRDQIWEMRIRSIGFGQKLVNLSDRTSAQAAEKMRVDFVANASHELLTPLAAVKGFIETLTETEAGSDKKTRLRFLKIMEDEASRMQSLIRDLMSLSRIEAGKYQLDAAPVNMEDVIADVVTPLRVGGDPRGQDIVVTIAPSLPNVLGDAVQMRQLVSNVIANAMKYGRAATPITVSLSPSRSKAMIAFGVTDEGEGIASEHIPRLTERFYRVDSGRSRSVGGTGLGLSLVKHIVDGHRGHLDISSKLGAGTKITILLPTTSAIPTNNAA